MSLNFAFGYILILMTIYTEVGSWTIDLPEVRRNLFEKNEKEKNDYGDYVSNKKTFYDNIDGNSMHNSKSGYQKNVEKGVLSVVHDGSAYLEGLRRAVERYIEYLENCTSTSNYTRINTSINSTLPQNVLPVYITNASFPNFNQSSPINSSLPNSNRSWEGIEKSQPGNYTNIGTSMLCQNVSRASEYVRRLAQLAVWTTKRLQDLVYAEEYQHDDGKEEDELIFKLAWFLDRLAKMTGYIPDPTLYLGEEPRVTTTSIPYPAPPMPDLSVPDDVMQYMMRCIKMDSPIPATVRCAFPLPLPPGLAQMFNVTDNTASTLQPTTLSERVSPLDSTPGQSSLELLTASDSLTPLIKNRHLFPFKNVQTRFINWQNNEAPSPRKLSDLTLVKTVKKRSIDEIPMVNLMKYYVKHSAWINSNPSKDLNSKLSNGDEMFEVGNRLTDVKSVQKRSLKKRNHFRVPDIPMPDLSKYVKNKPGVHYLRDHVVLDKIKNILERMHKHKLLNPKHKLQKPFRTIKKRSIKYERMYLPRDSENPMQDISYYVKNKEGTEYNPSVLQAAQARAALENHFQTGNILVVRQYGSNYNPLIPAPFYAGILRSMADS